MTVLKLVRVAALALCILVQPAFAERAEMVDALVSALRIDDTVAVMREEGMVYGDGLADQMVPDVNRESWARTLSTIYDPARMARKIGDRLDTQFRDEAIAPLLDYLNRDDVREILSLEISARRAFLDPETEAAAKARVTQMAEHGARLLDQVDTIIGDSDLVEANVAGALNADLMFYRGLIDGGAFDMSEGEVLSDVWGQEGILRETSRDWLKAFLVVAYQPLDAQVLDDYAAFWRTAEGRLLNRALFFAFDGTYEEISYQLGLAVAAEMTSERL